ncbi:MAG: bifunctional demethylmenaquinone methyltransferase/2-methoxy-6-polyprenyl-1,4-benzoquinol methylase UbiE [Gammaproteobacteria bacterium]
MTEQTTTETTHFGFKQIPANEKAQEVGKVFSSVANRYDIMNDVMSLGVHRCWKKFTVDRCHVRAGHRVLDLAGGSGDLARAFVERVGEEGHVYLADINAEMLQVGRDRFINKGIVKNISFVQANAEYLPFADNYFDRVFIAFGLRNVTHKEVALAAMHRVLKPGGLMAVLEFSKPTNLIFNKLYDAYSFNVIPKLGKLIANDEASYQYLVESIRMHPTQEELRGVILQAGFDECHYHNLSGGIVALHLAYKY